jgi:hypothetical protein
MSVVRTRSSVGGLPRANKQSGVTSLWEEESKGRPSEILLAFNRDDSYKTESRVNDS